MPSEASIVASMRGAQVPPHAYTTSLELQKQIKLHEIFKEKKYNLGDNSGLVSYLIRRPDRKRPMHSTVSKVCAVAAKELVLAGRHVYYLTLAEFVLAVRATVAPSMVSEPVVMQRIGKGYIVVGDLGANIRNWPLCDWEAVESFMLSHISRGGGLILGDTGMLDEGQCSFDFIDALNDFTALEVQ